MKLNQWHRDRINELEFLRKPNYDALKLFIPLILGFGAIIIAILGIYLTDIKKNYLPLVFTSIFFIIAMVILIILYRNISYKEKLFLVKIKLNYDYLLGRKK
tara:strand:+ start:31 stop:336 length:306 start_codon:yes stop_codon:yes gene_type:complete